MKILFDECIPKRLSRSFPGHEVQTVAGAGWAGIKNGELLKKASSLFEVFVTVDRNLSFQQNLQVLPLVVIVIHSSSNRIQDLERYVPEVVLLLKSPLTKTVHRIGI